MILSLTFLRPEVGQQNKQLCECKTIVKTQWQTQFNITVHTQYRKQQEFVRPRWPYDMRPSARAEKYIRDAGP